MGLLDAGALDRQVGGLEPGRPQAPGAPADRSLGPAEAPGDVEQPPSAVLGVEGVGQAGSGNMKRDPVAT